MSLNRKQYLVCVALCALIFAIGFLIALSLTIPDILLAQAHLTPDHTVIAQLKTPSTFKLILYNNSRVFLILTLGILTGGILSFIQSLVIGAFVGGVVRFSLDYGASSSLIMAALLPHGVFELAAFMVVAALGFYFPLRIYRYTQGLVIDWVDEVKTYGLISLGAYVVLLLAAAIEAFLTPTIAAQFLH